jgi:molybdate transport system substrate-binding protein
MKRRTTMDDKTAAGSVAARIAAASALAVALLAGAGPASAAEFRLLSAAVMQSVFKEIAGDFERASGHKPIIAYATMGAVNQRILNGETADLVIGSAPSISGFAQEGRIRAGSQATICKVGVGIVVPAGTPQPAIASIEDFKRALFAAKTLVYADPTGGGAAGIHIAGVIRKLGIADELKSKTKFGAGGDVTEVTLAQRLTEGVTPPCVLQAF